MPARFSAPFQTGPEAHPASYTRVAGSFRGVKRPGRGDDCPLYLAPRSSWSVVSVNFKFTFTFADENINNVTDFAENSQFESRKIILPNMY